MAPINKSKQTAVKNKGKADSKKKQSLSKQFILAVQSKPCIYDNDDPNFVVDDAVEEAWHQVAKECGTEENGENRIDADGVDDLKSKWLLYRKSFSKERSRRKKCGLEDSQNGGWSLYQDMLFMDKYIAVKSDKKQKQTCSKNRSAPGSKCSDKIENEYDADDSFDEKSSHNDNYQGFSQEENLERVQDQSSHTSKKHSKDIIVTDQASGSKGIDETLHSNLSLINARQSKVIKQSDDKQRKSELLLLAKAQARGKHKNTSPAIENQQGILGDSLGESLLIINQQEKIDDLPESQHGNLWKNPDDPPQQSHSTVDSDKKINKTFSDFFVATLDKVQDENERKMILKDIMNILYE